MTDQYESAYTGAQIDAAIDKALNLNVKNGDAVGAVKEGVDTSATAGCAHAEGYRTQALTKNAHAEGDSCIASGAVSHAEGASCIASGDVSHAEGASCIASHQAQHVEGMFNLPDGDYENGTTQATPGLLHIAGNGTRSIWTAQRGLQAMSMLDRRAEKIVMKGLKNLLLRNTLILMAV